VKRVRVKQYREQDPNDMSLRRLTVELEHNNNAPTRVGTNLLMDLGITGPGDLYWVPDGEYGAVTVTREGLARTICDALLQHITWAGAPGFREAWDTAADAILLALGAPKGATFVTLFRAPQPLPTNREERAKALHEIAWGAHPVMGPWGDLSPATQGAYLRLADAVGVEGGTTVEVSFRLEGTIEAIRSTDDCRLLHWTDSPDHKGLTALLFDGVPGTYTVTIRPKPDPPQPKVRPWRRPDKCGQWSSDTMCPECGTFSGLLLPGGVNPKKCPNCGVLFGDPIDLPDAVEVE
jgi:hypothetical protein